MTTFSTECVVLLHSCVNFTSKLLLIWRKCGFSIAAPRWLFETVAIATKPSVSPCQTEMFSGSMLCCVWTMNQPPRDNSAAVSEQKHHRKKYRKTKKTKNKAGRLYWIIAWILSCVLFISSICLNQFEMHITVLWKKFLSWFLFYTEMFVPSNKF